MPSVLGVQSLNHWSAREVPVDIFLNHHNLLHIQACVALLSLSFSICWLSGEDSKVLEEEKDTKWKELGSLSRV